jgi:hypothetical protein
MKTLWRSVTVAAFVLCVVPSAHAQWLKGLKRVVITAQMTNSGDTCGITKTSLETATTFICSTIQFADCTEIERGIHHAARKRREQWTTLLRCGGFPCI